MDERLHECTTFPSAAFSLAGPIAVFATTTPVCVSKPYSTPRCDEYPTRGTPCPTINGTISKPLKPVDQNILLTRQEEILLQARDRQYSVPPESTPTTLDVAPATDGKPLMIPCPNTEPAIRIPHILLGRNVNNP
jgi:hypothetical protein